MNLGSRFLFALVLAIGLPSAQIQQVATELPGDLKTIETLKAYEPKVAGPKKLRPVLGIRFGAYRKTGAEVLSVEPGSPAAAEGILPGDLVRMIGRYRIDEAEDLENALGALRVGNPVQLNVRRPAVKREVKVELGQGEQAGDPGFEYRHTQGHFEVTAVRGGSAAARAGLKVGDCFTQVDKTLYSGASPLRRALKSKTKFSVLVQREETNLLPSFKPAGAKEEEVLDWKGKSFKLAVLLVEFSDRKHNAKYTSKDFEQLMFSVGEYTQSPDGRKTYGSLRDYYKEMSVGTFDVTGKVFDWVGVPETWAYYDAQDMGGGEPGTRTIFQDALKGARDKFGANALDGFDGVVFLYAGERQSLRGAQLWPHRASIDVGGRGLPYYIIEEGGESFTSIGVHCHEFGHMLGLPDFYGYGHRTGVGEFCVMAIGHLGAAPSGPDRPFHMCAWCKIRLGWLTARTILPSERQHIALRGVEGRTNEALKILLSPTGEEYYLLEVRDKVGFDSDFFRAGLLVWHVGDDETREREQISVPIDLVEAHGKRYFDASLREESEILFPNERVGSFTPLTVPSSRSSVAGAYEVALTQIQVYAPTQLSQAASVPSGSVIFWIGDRTRVQPVQGGAPEQPQYPAKEPVIELDPVTKLPVPFSVDKDGVAAPGPAIMPRLKPGEDPPK
ncbi:MAG: M6 family metalloprotease domain-containing protein [Planctomycetes bacterium]|nr:M6 family metalloprotease domain-containing protein [Planctomycetota bacterium]